jgi:glycosyltransferase involved in cell wall biosynthesis
LIPALSVVLNAHREGILAHSTLAALRRAVDYAQGQGLSSEVVVVLDRPDDETLRIVTTNPALRGTDRCLPVEFGDLALARNAGLAAARGAVATVLDADDYPSLRWLLAGVARQRQHARAILHPEFVVSFGRVQDVVRVPDQERDAFPGEGAFPINPWVSCALAATRVFLDFPYAALDTERSGFGYEDWHWNCETIAAGYAHLTAPGTALFYRRKALGSLAESQVAQGAMRRPSAYFRRRPAPWAGTAVALA